MTVKKQVQWRNDREKASRMGIGGQVQWVLVGRIEND